MGSSYEYLLLKLGLKLNTSGDSVFESSQAKLSGHASVGLLVGQEVVRNFKKDGVVVFLVVVLLVVGLLVVVLLIVVLLVVVLIVVVLCVELSKL